ncbi:hypothetical protein AB4Y85_16470 [Microvirga sp. 2YAF29]|uniref:hypothetical protein n=1 Tax=Microvirga sp. 2YAF29 TaxID=3233031 RepID=UPI003F9AB075
MFDLRIGRGFIVVGAAWLLLVTLLLVLQASGQNFGFNVWPVGEARIWMKWLQDGPGPLAAQIYWRIDGRNPLSPWWYISVREFIRTYPAAFLVLHLATSLMLGLASYLLVITISAGRARLYGVSLGILAGVFVCSTRVDNIHWLFILALVCSLLSVACFAQFLNSGRRPVWLLWSLILWMVAYQTYTIQSGAVLAVGVVSFLQGGHPYDARNLVKRAFGAVADALPYATTLLLFVLVWRTASTGVTETTSFSDPGRIFQSLRQGLWHSDYSAYWNWALQLEPRVVLIVLVSLIPLFFMTQWLGGRSDRDDIPINFLDLARLVLVGICLVVPTVVLEVTSPMHPPGSRWMMLLQFWTPLLVLSVTALALLALPLSSRLKCWIWWGATATFATGAVVLTLGFNQFQINISRQERAFMSELRRIAVEDRRAKAEFPRHYLIKPEPAYWIPSDFLSRAYIETQSKRFGEVTFRYLRSGTTMHPPIFRPDGVANPEQGERGFAPWSRVGVLTWDGTHMTRMSGADRSAFDGLGIDWQRSEPLP